METKARMSCGSRCQVRRAGVDAERNDHAGQDKEILDGVIEPDDGEMGAKPLGEGDLGALGGWHQ